MERKNAWLKYDEAEMKACMEYCEGYRRYLTASKTERESVAEAVKLLKEHGYRDLKDVIAAGETLKAGDKVYSVNMDKTLSAFLIGEEPMEKGMKILGAHVDSPRLDIKQNPLYEDMEMVLLDTHYYGGIKKYQWVATPLALHGVVFKKDGSRVDVVIGEKEDDPVLCITDLLPHLGAKQMSKTAGSVIEGEDLNVLFGSMPVEPAEAKEDETEEEKAARELAMKGKVKANILNLLKETYGIEEEDFLSAELEVVPAGACRDLGIDRSMLMGYGHDDRVCAYTSLTALLSLEKVDRTCVCSLVDKEEIGSAGATGIQSKYFENEVAEVMNALGQYSELKVRRALANSEMFSSDVSAAVDPNYPGVNEMKNSAFLAKGLTFNKFTGSRGKGGSNDANPEFIAKLRRIMDENEVSWQTAELGRVDEGGGGTIARYMAEYNMQVIDSGVPVLSMHAPWEVVSKADVYEAMKGYTAFLKNA
ncbi:MAG: aminopeptidase [Lachnospiraceae bacterium]|nr:aminopeptidase [Lachnospiraceae bacterium]